jgi:signal-transduction protein with cAMP-binding, CBS, and nucleotidyltransferase domain
MLQVLREHILKSLPQLVNEIEEILPHFSLEHFKRETMVLDENSKADRLFFVCQGMLHFYYTHSGKNPTIHFALAQWWLTDYKSFPTSGIAQLFIAAVEDSDVAVINKETYDALLLKYPLLAIYFNDIHQRAYGAALLKQKTYATTSKADFYHYFKTTYPFLIERVPDSIFASYMGVSLQTFKKIKAAHLS